MLSNVTIVKHIKKKGRGFNRMSTSCMHSNASILHLCQKNIQSCDGYYVVEKLSLKQDCVDVAIIIHNFL